VFSASHCRRAKTLISIAGTTLYMTTTAQDTTIYYAEAYTVVRSRVTNEVPVQLA
jgi:hypothetical protein